MRLSNVVDTSVNNQTACTKEERQAYVSAVCTYIAKISHLMLADQHFLSSMSWVSTVMCFLKCFTKLRRGKKAERILLFVVVVVVFEGSCLCHMCLNVLFSNSISCLEIVTFLKAEKYAKYQNG